MDYIKLGLFKIVIKILKVIYKLDLLNKMKIYLKWHIIIFKPIHKNLELLVYKVNIYKSKKKRQITS